MTNVSVLVGRLTKDPELKYTQTGVAVTRFTLAVNRQFKSANGEQEADFIQVVAWRKTAELVANYLRKGSQVSVTGRIQTGSFEGQDGKRVYTVEVVADNVQFLEPKGAGNGNSSPQYQGTPQPVGAGAPAPQQTTDISNDPFTPGGGPIEVTDDDLPF